MDLNDTTPLQEVFASFSSAAKQQSTHGASSIVTRQLSKFSETRTRDRCGAAVSQCATAVCSIVGEIAEHRKWLTSIDQTHKKLRVMISTEVCTNGTT